MRKRILGWRRYAIAGLCAAMVVLLDVFMTRGGSGGFCPHDTTWVFSSSDFPSFYSGLLDSDVAAAVSAEAPEYQAAWQLSVRKSTGIRPTPLRWRVWLGRHFLGATSPEGRGACVRPGVVLRVADMLAGLAQWRPRVRQFGRYYYGWREGYLVFSQSEKYVLASLDAERFVTPQARSEAQFWIYETRSARSALGLSANKHLLVTGWTEGGSLQGRQQPLSLAPWPPGEAMAWAASSRLSNLSVITKTVFSVAERHADLTSHLWYKSLGELLRQGAKRWGADALPADWDAGTNESAFILFDIDDSETIPVPEAGLILRKTDKANGAHPLEPLGASGPVIPYEWQGRPGRLIPLAGEKATLCLSSLGHDWLAASQEPVMARLMLLLEEPLTQQTQTDAADAAAVVCLDWSKLSERALLVTRKWAQMGLVPLNKDVVENRVAPLMRAVGRLGVMQVDWREQDGRLHFEGLIDSGVVE